MYLLFNLASLSTGLSGLSESPESVGYSILQGACLDNGLPLPPSPFDQNLSLQHSIMYNRVKDYVDESLLTIPTPDNATLTHMGSLQFRLDLY